MKAVLKNYRQSPRKVRLVADMVRGRDVEEAMRVLEFTPRRAASVISKVIASAAANAKQTGKNVAALKVDTIRVDEGFTLKRFMPRAFGRASRINKRTSHIQVTLAEK